jgi:hypothetical protein
MEFREFISSKEGDLYLTEKDGGNIFFSDIFYEITSMPYDLSKKFSITNEKNVENMKKYYEGREYVINQKNKKSILMCMDGSLNPEEKYIFDTESIDKALEFCYFITIQKRKYDLFIDKNIILDFNLKKIELFLRFYRFMETLRWTGSKKLFFETIKLYEKLSNDGKIKKLSQEKPYIDKFIKEIISRDMLYYESPPIKNISGLLTVVLLRSSKYNKNIYLLGEKHNQNIQCDDFLERKSGKGDEMYKIWDSSNETFVDQRTKIGKSVLEKVEKSKSVYVRTFIDNILRNDSFFVDFLFESWYSRLDAPSEYNTMQGGQGSALYSFNDNDCLEKDYKNIYSKQKHKGKYECFFYRIEAVDYRNIREKDYMYSFKDGIIDFFEDEKNIFYTFKLIGRKHGPKKDFLLPQILDIPYVQKIIREFITEEGRLYVLNYLMNDIIFKDKQLMNDIKKSYLSKEIISFMRSEMNIFLSEFNKNIWPSDAKIYRGGLLYKLISLFFSLLHTYIMDGFFLSKLFKKMKHDPNEEHGPDEIRNCIIFAGNDHNKRYIKFLKYIGFSEKSSAEAYDNSCVNIEDFSQPFFVFEDFLISN